MRSILLGARFEAFQLGNKAALQEANLRGAQLQGTNLWGGESMG